MSGHGRVLHFPNVNPFDRTIGLDDGLVSDGEVAVYWRSARAFAEYERALGRPLGDSPALKALRRKYLGPQTAATS